MAGATKMFGRAGWTLGAVAALLLGGCYQGLDGVDPAGDGGDPDVPGGEDDVQRDPSEAQCQAPDVGETPLRRLTRSQYDNTVRDLLGVELGLAEGFVSDEKLGPFDSNTIAVISDLAVEQYMDAAEQVATEAVVDLPGLLPCDPAELGETECAVQLIAQLGPRAYRRPLSAEQRDDLLALYHYGRDEGGFADGVRLVVQGMLQSPFFLYHLEEVPAGGEGQLLELSAYETASRLSYFLWGSMPDDALFAAAAADELSTPEQLRAQAERMIADPKAAESIRRFHVQWLEVGELSHVDKDPELFPAFSAELAESMQEEIERFTEHVVLEGEGTLETMLTASYTIADEELAALYGVEHPGGEAWQRIELPDDERSGLLTLAGIMASHSHSNQTSPVLRGAMVRENFLCQTPPPPPDNVNDDPPGLDATKPTKERYEQHREDPVCAACHNLMDPLGYAFENFDAMGQFRTQDGNFEVDATGEFLYTDDLDGPYEGHREFNERLAGSRQVQQCVSKQWFRYAMGRLENEADDCTLDRIFTDFSSSNFDIRELMVGIAVSDAVRHLKVEE